MRVMTVVGTRPEIIRLSRVMAALDRHVEHVLVHTGQNYDYELNQVFFDDLEIRKPDLFLEAAAANAAETVVFRGGQTATPVRIHALAEGRPPRLIRQSSWSIVPTQRELVLFFPNPNPGTGLVRLRHFVDTKVEDPPE